MIDDLTNPRWYAALAILAVSGCASVPSDLGRGDVNTLLADRGQAVEAKTDELLESLTETPLSSDSAVRIALMNNPRLQATYATLGFGAADIYEAGRIRNPIISGAFLDSSAAGELDQITLGLVASFTDLITLRARTRLSRGTFAALKQSVGAEVLTVAAETERAYYQYVGTQQVAALRAQIAKAGGLSAALAQRFSDAGNLTPRELALERTAASAARLAALDAEAAAFGARTELAGMLGLSVGANWVAPAALRLPIKTEDELSSLIALAKDARLDLAAARTRADVLADQLGVVNWTRWLGELDVGIERERETDGVKLTGPTVDWEIPIFNQHKDLLLRADAELQIAVYAVRETAIAVDNSVRLAYANLVNARARIEEYRTGLIPQRIETVARGQEEVNFMLIGIFELIALKQDEYDAYQGYLETIRDYWLARVDLSLATGAALPSNAQIREERIDVQEFVQPVTGGMDHSGHGAMDVPSMDMEMDGQNEAPMDHSGHQPTDSSKPMDHSGHSMKKSDTANEVDENEQHHEGGSQ
ncbi:MAG: TolC family protein [Gammaproteobacteria bacterium]|nr:TolC family protein [Gammaproteobacteria bacterium]MDH5620537.1 TolC family protein [Gammaproteobacteria bacterium]